MKRIVTIITLVWILTIFLLAFFSYTQIDLNLTLSQNPLYLSLQNNLIQLGYFNRNLNTEIFSILFILLALFYLLFVYLSYKKLINLNQLHTIILITAVICTFSYNAFSHDFFNYMFNGKIVTFYHLSPYQYRALDFPQDDWTRFMQWTHVTMPYGPSWLIVITLVSALSFSKFIVHFFLLKLTFSLTYLFSALLVTKIAQQRKTDTLIATSLFAFHPLIIIDGLISPHIDLIMYFFVLVSLFYFLKNSIKKSYLIFLVSIGIKYASVTMLPLLFKKVYISNPKYWSIGIFLSGLVGSFVQVYNGGLQPWYLIGPTVLIFMLFPSLKLKWIVLLGVIFELPLVGYLVFLFRGFW